eukprot:TRINITY_DN215_c0_g1_i1.p1 TRINITY_DN215_c0_g1~~TRINITY_DN215_c0_g1_i1.p1  ORF type:complete len:119 (+),score=14.20 TRINITY_DN215_c0_g1_i1:403-759(+)
MTQLDDSGQVGVVKPVRVDRIESYQCSQQGRLLIHCSALYDGQHCIEAIAKGEASGWPAAKERPRDSAPNKHKGLSTALLCLDLQANDATVTAVAIEIHQSRAALSCRASNSSRQLIA